MGRSYQSIKITLNGNQQERGSFFVTFNRGPEGSTLGWAEKLKMSKIYYGHEVPVVIHKNKGIPLFTF